MQLRGDVAVYVVIFTAEIAGLDAEYAELAQRMRDLALNDYGCMAFNSCAQDGREIAVSYWESEAQIKAWREHSEHKLAQDKGRSLWYRAYSVQVAKITREYAGAETGMAGPGLGV